MKKNDNNLNNYCMNCGKKVKENDEVCKNCNTLIVNKRIRTDNNYIFYLLFCAILIGAGFFLDQPLFFLVQYLILCYCYREYKRSILVLVIFWLETIPIFYYLLILILLLVFCGI